MNTPDWYREQAERIAYEAAVDRDRRLTAAEERAVYGATTWRHDYTEFRYALCILGATILRDVFAPAGYGWDIIRRTVGALEGPANLALLIWFITATAAIIVAFNT